MKLLVLLLGGAGLALGQCTGCWPETQGPCKQTNSVCWPYVGGVCPVGTSPCGNSSILGTTPLGFCSTQWSEYSGGNVAKCVPCSSSANCEAGRECWGVAYCKDNIVCGSAAAVTACPGGFRLNFPLDQSGTYLYDFLVYWGDNVTTVCKTFTCSHTYTTAGLYPVTVSGVLNEFSFSYQQSMAPYLVDIVDWGSVCLGTTGSQFNNINLSTWTATGQPCIQDPTSFLDIFYNASRFNQPLAGWDTRNVTDMKEAFWLAASFNQPLSSWNTQYVSNMYRMFYQAAAFNQPVEAWNVGNVTNMQAMFREAVQFNQPLSAWNTAKVTNFAYMFYGASAFNNSVQGWDTSQATNMQHMFYQAASFNQPVGNWNTGKVTIMRYMFAQSAFNQPLGDWNVGMCTDFAWMFQNMPFNQPLDNWNMSKAADISKMFDTNTAFNQSLGAWDVSAVTNCLSFAGGGALALSNYPAGIYQQNCNLGLAWDCAFVDFSEDPAVKDGSCTACSAGSQSVAADCLAFTCSPGYISRSPSPFCILPSPSPSPSFSPSKSPVSATPSTSLSPSPISTSPSVSLSPSVSDSLSSSQSISISSSLSLTPTISTTPSSSPSASSSKTSSASTSTSRSPTPSASPSHLPSLSPSKSPAAVVAMPVLCGDGACQTAATGMAVTGAEAVFSLVVS
eukprot:g22392.t1